jgi:hypothetical protein
MQTYTPRPHISAALAHLRHGVTAAAVIVLFCAVVQMMAFGFVHFTNVRWETASTEAAAPTLAVVTRSPGETAAWKELAIPTRATQHKPLAVEFPKIPSRWDAGLHVMSDMAVTAGVIACVLLAAMCILGVSVAGGASVPGVERAVSAATWSMLLAVACIPWSDFFHSVPFAGVFGSYEAMTTLSTAVDRGTGSSMLMVTNYVFIPIAALACAMLTLSRFRSGVEQGIIVTSVNELDEHVEREMSGIRARGVSSSGSRAVGALNQAIGEKPALTLVQPDPPLAATGTTGKPAGNVRNWLTQKRIGEANPGDRLQRPI